MSVVVTGAGGAIVGSPTTPETTSAESENHTITPDVNPEEEPYLIEIRLVGEPPGTTLGLLVETWYPAQNETEAQQAENGTLDLDWFDGDDRLKRAFEERDVTEESFEYYRESPRSEFVDTGSDNEPHGRIIVRYSAHWRNVTTPYEPPVAEFGAAFRSGDALSVEAPGEAVHHNADSESYDRGIYTYSWTLDPDNETPELVFEEGAFESDAHGPLGPAGGIVLSLIALLVAAHLRVRNRDR